MRKDRSLTKVTEHDLVGKISDASGMKKSLVKSVLSSLEAVLTGTLKEANQDTDVSVRIFEGFFVESTFIPGGTRKNNLTGRMHDTNDKIKVKIRTTPKSDDRLAEAVKSC